MTSLSRGLTVVLSSLVMTVAFALPGAAASASGSAASASEPAVPYRAVELGTLGGARTWALGLNDRGQVVGRSDIVAGTWRPFLWQRGRMVELKMLDSDPGEWGSAEDINVRGDVVGLSTVNGDNHAVLWRRGRIIDLGDLGGEYSYATAINDLGQVVGVSATATGELRGFIWQNGRMRDLGIDGPTQPLDINNRGQAVGWSGRGVEWQQRAFLWQRGTVRWLPTPGRSSRASAINERGEIAGGITVDAGEGVSRAVRWHRGRIVQLGTLPGGNASSAVAINDRGQIIGRGNVQPYSIEERAFLYWRGKMWDLTGAGIPPMAAYSLTEINNHGQVLAGATLYKPGATRYKP